MLKTPEDFVIIHRDRSEEPDSIYSCDGRLAACVSLSINYSLGYIFLPRVQNALVQYAVEHSRFEQNAWYKDPVHGYQKMEDLVTDFTNSIIADHFLICIDSTITNPDYLSFTASREWDGRFRARNHCISLNGPVRDRPSSPKP